MALAERAFAGRHWAWRDAVVPFLVTSLLLLAVAWCPQALPRNPEYPRRSVVERGWALTPVRLLDVWGRWDTGWYMSIVRGGYSIEGPVGASQSNFAFFPGYPYLVKAAVTAVPARLRGDTAILLIGVVVSNACFLAALILLRSLLLESHGDERAARRANWYLALFPTSFFFSCFYTEALFLLLSVAAFRMVQRRAWPLAGAFGGLAALTRPNGVVIVVPLLVASFAAHGWELRRIRRSAGWLLLVPAGFLSYLIAVHPISGDLLAPLKVQAAWGKGLEAPWVTLFEPLFPYPVTTAIERWLIIALLVAAVLAFRVLPDRSHAVYAAAMLLPPLFTGVLNSSARYAGVLFPLFATLAVITRQRPRLRWLIVTVSSGLLIIAFAAWCQLYWVG